MVEGLLQCAVPGNPQPNRFWTWMTLGCPHGPAGSGRHCYPSPVLVPGLQLSPFRGPEMMHLSTPLALKHKPEGGLHPNGFGRRVGHPEAVGRCSAWCQQLCTALVALFFASVACEPRWSDGMAAVVGLEAEPWRCGATELVCP